MGAPRACRQHRSRRLRSIEALAEAHPENGGDFICRLVTQLGDYISEAVDRLEAKLEESEDSVKDSLKVARNSPFTALRRQFARVRRYLGPQREALEQLVKAPGDLFDANQLAVLREESNRLTLMLEDLGLVRERAMVALEEFLGVVAHEQNERMLDHRGIDGAPGRRDHGPVPETALALINGPGSGCEFPVPAREAEPVRSGIGR